MRRAAALEDIDWSSLEHAYGAATDTAGHLAALASRSAKQRKDALTKLDETIHHQTETYSASAAAVPYLASLIAARDYPDRVELLRFLVALAVGDPSTLPVQGFDVRTELGRNVLNARIGGLATYKAVADALPELTALLADPDVAVRRAAGYAVSPFADHAPSALPALRQQLAVEDDAHARASLILAVRLLARATNDRTDVQPLQARVAKGAPGNVDDCAAAIALLTLSGRDDRAVALLAKLKATKKVPGWEWGDLRAIAKWTIDGLDLDLPIAELLAELDASDTSNDRKERIIDRLLPLLFAPRRGSYLLPGDLMPAARHFLESAVRQNISLTPHAVFLHHHGVPPPMELGHWLSMREPGLLSTTTSVGGRSGSSAGSRLPSGAIGVIAPTLEAAALCVVDVVKRQRRRMADGR